MGWSVCLVCDDGFGDERRVELLSLGAIRAPADIDDVGIDRATGRKLLSELQRSFVIIQEAELRASARRRVALSSEVTLKDCRSRKVQTLFGTVVLRVPRLLVGDRVETCLATGRHARATREFDDIRARLSAWMSYRAAMALLGDLYPIKDGISPATALRRIANAAEVPEPLTLRTAAPREMPVSMPLDTTFVRGRDTDVYHGLEVLVGAVEQGTDPVHCFAAPIAMKDDCVRLGKAAISGRGAGQVEAFSDSDRAVRAMSHAIGVTSKPISDWFHLSMRIRHVVSVADALEAPAGSIDRANIAVQAELRIMRAALWKGDTGAVSRARRTIQPHLKRHADEPSSSDRQKRVKRLRNGMRKLAKHVTNPDARIVDYCSRKSARQRLGTSLVEGAANFVVNARMAKSQHMRWSTRGAYNLLQVRTADINRRAIEAKEAA